MDRSDMKATHNKVVAGAAALAGLGLLWWSYKCFTK